MFYLLCFVLCLAVWFLVLAGTAIVCTFGARLLGSFVYSSKPASAARWLFAIHVLPSFFAGLVTFGFALPAFLKFEPRFTNEMVSLRLLVLGALGVFALLAMGIRAAKTMRATMLLQEQWRSCSTKLHLEGMDVPVYCLNGSRSVLAVLGIFKPEIFVARELTSILSSEELSAAIAHEKAHIRSFDNLKQMLLKITRLPSWANTFPLTESAWINASEIAADETALAIGASPLDLSAALVKVARITSRPMVSEAVAASHLLPVVSGSSMEARMRHLQELLESKGPSGSLETQNGKYRMLLYLLLLATAYGACVNAVLPWAHEVLEALVQ